MTSELPPKLASKLTHAELEIWQAPWYHNFTPLGLPGVEQHEIQLGQQLEKQGGIFRHIRDAFLRIPKNPRVLHLTSTDGLFGLYAATKGAGHVDIVHVSPFAEHNNPRFLDQTRIASKLLDLDSKTTISVNDVFEITGAYDMCICTGALYNLPEPALALKKIYDITNGPLVVHEHTWLIPLYAKRARDVRVGQLEREVRFLKEELTKQEINDRRKLLTELKSGDDELFYESPATYRPWGSRFSHDTLIIMAVDAGWTVINEKVAEVPPLNWLDRGSTSLLCV